MNAFVFALSLSLLLVFSACLEDKEQVNSSEKNGVKNTDEAQIYFENEKLTDTLKKIRQQLPPDDSHRTKLSPYEEIFFNAEKKNSKKSIKLTAALTEYLNAYKLSNWIITTRDRLNNENLLANEKYKKGMSLLESSSSDNILAYTLMMEASIDGSQEAKGEVAWAMLFGNHLPQNIELAKDIFEELALEGDPTGHTGMAFLHSIGLGVAFDQRKALIHFLIAALGGSPWARMALGYRYLHGISVPTSCENALTYYKLAAESVAAEYQPHGGITVQKISIVEESEDYNYKVDRIGADLKDYYEMQAESGEVPAQVVLGQLYYRGAKGLPRDLKKSLHYLQLAASNGNPLANAFIGKIYLEGGENIRVDLPKAYKYLKKAVDHGNAVGEAGLGIMYLKGMYVERDYRKAIQYFNKSASRGWVEAMIELGKIHYLGLLGSKDIFLAKKYFMNAAQAGHVLSYYYLGLMSANGIGTMRSCMTAVDLLKLTSERGKWGNLFMEAYELYKNKKYKEALVIYAVLAEMGYAVGQSNAAFILDEYFVDLPLQHPDAQGENISPNWIRQRKALQYWSRSALQGYPRAVLKIGDHHYYGQGTDVDFETASIYYKYCAQIYHNAQAVFNLGYMHEHGLGSEKDLHLARRCYDLAMEWSEDAWLPVGLALLKLNLLQIYSSIIMNNWRQWFQLKTLDDLFGTYWDIFLIALLTCIAIRLINMRLLRRDVFFDILNWLN